MKKIYPILVLALLSLGACKKDKEEENVNGNAILNASEYQPLKTGYYWLYNLYRIEPNGAETLLGIDSSFIEKDTLISGKTYYKWVSPPEYGPIALPNLWVRDSLDYIVNRTGGKIFSVSNYKDTLSNYRLGDTISMGFFTMADKNKTITVPAGSFTTIARVGKHTLFAPYDGFGKTRESITRFAPKIGLIMDRYFELNSADIFERRLVRYKVK